MRRIAPSLFLLLVSLSSALALAEPSKLAEQGRAYAAKNNLPIREFKHDLGKRVVDRMFVPVLPTTVDSFVEHFSIENHAATWRAQPNDLVHGGLNLGLGRSIHYTAMTNQLIADNASAKQQLNPGLGGNYVTFSLEKEQLDHWTNFMLKYAPNTNLYNGRNLYKTPKGECHGSCMWWMVHGEVGPELNVAQHLGVQRAKGPEVLFPRAVHSGDANVGPIGVAVKSIEEFNAMTEAQLFGPEPAGGAAARVHLKPGEQAQHQVVGQAQLAPQGDGPAKLSVAEAAKLMGKHVFMATGSAQPSTIASAMQAEAMTRPDRTDVYYMSTFASADNFAPEVSHKWHANLFFVSRQNQEAAAKGHATLHRASLFEHANAIKAGTHPIDTIVVRVSPPDKDGMVSLGTTGDLTMTALEEAVKRGGRIIAEVNPNVPHTFGNRIPYKMLSAVVENNTMLAEAPANLAPLAPERALAAHVASLVPAYGATIQVGIGNSLNGIGQALVSKHDMKIWSELGADWAQPLLSGPNPVVKDAVFSFLHGSNALYQLANNNPAIRMSTSHEVNNPQTVATKPNMRAINTALEVDVTGNVNAERIGDRIISAPGGQPDFMRGASTSPSGRAILGLRSLTKNHESTIVLNLHGNVVTTQKNNVDHVVTEWGSTPLLRGLDDRSRIIEIIKVAHPIHRKALADEALAAGKIGPGAHAELVNAVHAAIMNAPLELRRQAADLALGKGILNAADHALAVNGCPPIEPGL
jgi:acyl-CoA hydrolase